MTLKCVIRGCPNTSDTIIHYMLPMDPQRRRLWVKFIEKHKSSEDADYDWRNSGSSCRVCGDHFPEADYITVDLGNSTCKILSVDAVPTVYDDSGIEENAIYPKTQEAEKESIDHDAYNISISEAVSLACVKGEPEEFELSQNIPAVQEQEGFLEEDIKEEETEVNICVEEKQVNHGKYKSINCLKCGMRFRTRRTLMKHQRLFHVKENTRKINKEEKERAAALQIAHSREENIESKHVCQQCGKGFEHQAFLKAHQKIHEDFNSTMPFSCHICSKRFANKLPLVAHMKHHSSKVSCPKCPVCEKSFQFRGSLVQHIKSFHVGEKLLCKICHKSFRLIHGFIKHFEKHNVITPFHCELCKIYLSERGFRIHMLQHKQKENSDGDPTSAMPEEIEIEPLGEDDMEEALEESSFEAGTEDVPEENHELEG
ncbi:hypothetical protein DNTS_015333 [Danionella cerebrum]|uniref:C2H2-type domain-containing protein n=1 Tax=Danionella cerebrum TaxID=2873325 RepID=A0A553NWR6_9TELE|nr:hypothetical protein DNTS_015333 [Danionella translucida]